jgi:hypothetical protein
VNRLLRGCLVAATVVTGAALGSALRAFAMERFVAAKTVEDVYYVPPPDWLVALSLGHREALAAALYPRARVYFGEGFIYETATRHVFDYAEAMVTLDPDFREVYRFLATTALYRRVAPTREEMLRVVEFVRRGADRFPDDGKLAWNAAATMAYEVAPHLASEERERLEDAAQPYFARAVETGDAPAWMALSTAEKLTRLGQAERAAQQLAAILPTIDDEATRAEMFARLAELRATADHEGLVHTLETLGRRHKAEFPYVPFDFYLVLGSGELTAPLPASPLDLLEPREGER